MQDYVILPVATKRPAQTENIELDKSRIGVSVGTNDDRYGEMSYFGN